MSVWYDPETNCILLGTDFFTNLTWDYWTNTYSTGFLKQLGYVKIGEFN